MLIACLSPRADTVAWISVVEICRCTRTKLGGAGPVPFENKTPAGMIPAGGSYYSGLRGQIFDTLAACGPFGPWVTSYFTLSPSFRLRNPSD
jgi:hypothetical protein